MRAGAQRKETRTHQNAENKNRNGDDGAMCAIQYSQFVQIMMNKKKKRD